MSGVRICLRAPGKWRAGRGSEFLARVAVDTRCSLSSLHLSAGSRNPEEAAVRPFFRVPSKLTPVAQGSSSQG